MTTYYTSATIRNTGDTKYLDGTVVDSLGVAVNITGAAISYIIYDGKQTALITKTIGAGVVITNGAGGLYTITLAAVDTATFASGKQYMEKCTMTLAGDVGTLFEGPLSYIL